jgi:hypothetical protein
VSIAVARTLSLDTSAVTCVDATSKVAAIIMLVEILLSLVLVFIKTLEKNLVAIPATILNTIIIGRACVL